MHETYTALGRSGRILMRSGQMGLAHQEAVAFTRGSAPFVDGPDHKALAAPAISGRKYTGNIRAEPAILRLGIGARINFHTELRQHIRFGPEKAHRNKHQVGRVGFPVPGMFLGTKAPPSFLAHSTVTVQTSLTRPLLSPTNLCGDVT